MPLITWKRTATGVLFSAAAIFLMVGVLLRDNVYVVIGGTALLLVVGLVVIAAYRRVGYNMQQVADQQRALLMAQETLDGINRKVLKLDDSLRRAAVGELRPLVLSAFRDVSDQIDRTTEAVSQRDMELAQRLDKVEKLSSVIEASTRATGISLDHHRALLRRLFDRLHGDVLERLDEINGRFEKQLSEHRSSLDEIRVSLKDVARTVELTSRSEQLEKLSSSLNQIGDGLVQRFDELGERSAKAASEEWQSLEKHVVVPLKQLSREIGAGHLRFDVLNDIWSMQNLHQTVRPTAIAPQMTAWSLEPTSLARLLHIVLERKPKLIVECGSGASTVWLAYAAREVGAKVIALEHLEKYAEASLEEVERHGLSEHAEVRFAPLEAFDVGGEEYSWYSRDAWKELAGIDLLLVDGPPKATGDHARYPAVPLLEPGIGAGALIVLDDVHREEEREALTRWREQFRSVGAEHSIGPRTVAVEWNATGRP
ncbi:O-methyltransferase [Novilysobacter defluvii]|uniref:Protein-L-isoaspartate O-methyltransferase n=3 Tax=Novilysobacter TaxID=3382699 RepID=A0A0A0M9N1_9GAMM|nr:class I SAM-dependent methyltransferase [Lysobacter defluvii]KGO99780.1 protein-L-isoaspartate O-methyltransferase [Lysobacter defluvii IMMIB APB-9 = DSM 18482]